MTLKNYIYAHAPAIASGATLVFCFPTFDLYPLAWIALSPLLVSLWGKRPAEAFAAGMLMGIFYFFGTAYWIYYSISHYGHLPLFLSIALVFLLCLYLSLYTGLFAMAFSARMQASKLPAFILAPVFWVLLEYIRSYALTGFPWSSIGYSQYKFLPAIQIADITGIYGVSFLVLAVNGAVADIFLLKKRLSRMPLFPVYQTILSLAVFAVFLAAIFTYGFWRLNQQRPGDTLRVSLIQGNIAQDEKWNPEFRQQAINTYKDLTLKASSMSPSLIIWPETAVPFYFGYDEGPSGDLVSFQHSLNSYLLFGSVLIKKPPSSEGAALLSNSAVLLDRAGKVSYVYDKIHLVPFGEYVPLRTALFFVDKLVHGIGDFIPGDRVVRANTEIGSFSVYICYEIIFPGLVRKGFSKGGDFIVTITNDAWFGRTTGPYQHFSMAVFRAIENRKPVVRAANSGISGYIDSNGRIQNATRLFEGRAETVDIKKDGTLTFYSRYGDIFSYFCIIAALFLLI